MFLGISTSGNSKNVMSATVIARALGLKVIGLTEAKGGELAETSDVAIKVPETETYMIQELHLPVYHCLCLMLEDRFFENKRGKFMRVIVSGYVGKKITGIGRNLIETLNNIRDDELEFVVYTNFDMKDDMIFSNPNVTVKYYKISRENPIGNLLWTTLWLPVMAIKEKADKILISNFTLLLFPVKPTVIYLHDMTEYHVEGKQTKSRMIYRKKLAIPMSAKNAKEIITVSNSSKKDIMEILGVPESKITLIYPGIKRENFRKIPMESALEIIKGKHWTTPFILYVGTIDHPGRNLINLTKAYEKLRDEGRYFGKLLLAGGKGKGYEVVEAYVKASRYTEDIILAGFITDAELEALYSLCDVFCYLSLYEGFGLPPLEAIASGARSIVSNTSSLPEAVGDVGIKVDPMNVNEIADAIYETVSKKTDDSYFDRVEAHLKKFSWKEGSKILADVLKKKYRENK
jgi:glycosyltransferase involved in cell wall biosynthesis